MTTPSTVSRARGKTAQVSLRDYEDDDTVKQFEPISDSLKAQDEDELGFAPVEVTPRYLSSLAAGLAWFQEVALGRNSPAEGRVMTKLPHKIFSDFKPKGALEILLATCLRFKETHGLRRLDLKNLDRKKLYLDMLKMCERNLKAKKAIPMYKIYFTCKLRPEKERTLRTMVNRRAVVVTNMEDASHIVYNDPQGCSIEETEGVEVEGGGGRDYCWTLAKKDKFSLVHWWYCPDSYNQWIPSTDVQGEPEPEEEHRGPWHVGARFIEDTDYFNEWMNETDYEIPPEDRDKIESPPIHAESDRHARERSSRKRKREHASSRELGEALETVKARRIQSDSQREEDKAREREKARAKERRRERDRERSARKRKERERQRERRERDRARRKERELEKARRKKEEEQPDAEVREKDIVAINEHARKRERERERKRLALDAKSEDSRASALKIRLSLRGADEAKGDGSRDRKKEKDKTKKKELRRVTEREEKEKEPPTKAKALPPKKKTEDETKLAASKERTEGAFERTASPEDVIKTERANQMTRGGPSSDKPYTEDGNKGLEMSEKDSQAAENRRTTKDEDIREEVRRKKSKRERRDRRDRERSKRKQPGVTFVESAIPLAENDVRRIRNLSMEGQDEIGAVQTEGHNKLARRDSLQEGSRESREKQGTSSAPARHGVEEQQVMNGPEGKKKAGVEESAQDGQNESRVRGVAVSALKGEDGGAPSSVADLIDALPKTPVRIPAQARWFRLDSIHETEKRALSEFFSNKYPSKTPKVYKVYRDFMIHAWRNAPDKYLTATSVRRQLAGDVCAILRVHSFLEHWGLINYGVNPSLRPSAMPLARTHAWRTTPVAVSDVNSKSTSVPRILLFDESTPQRRNAPPVSLKQAMTNASKLPPGQVSLASRREVYAAAAATTYTCDSCGADCSKTRYHCIGAADMDLCPQCFADGKYPAMLGARDFEQLTTALQVDDLENPTWSETEVLLLLEALEKYGDNWDAVTKHVGTKSRDACVLHFLRLPIEDSFLGDQLGKWGRKNGENQFEGQLFPFADAGNPVMAQVAFLASSVGPEVAAAAAQAALSVLMGGEVSEEVKRERERLAGVLMNGHTATGIVDEQSKDAIEYNRKLQKERDSSSPGKADGATPMEGVQIANGAPPKADGSPSGAENVGKEKAVPADEAPRKDASPESLDPAKRPNLDHGSTINGARATPGSAPSKPRSSPEPRSGTRPVTTDLDAAAVRASAAVALAAASARARKLADAEAREIERLFAVILETKLRALEAKMKHFEDFETYVRAEREALERQRQQLYCERISIAMSKRTSNSMMGLESSRPDGFGHQGSRFDDHPFSLGPLKLPAASSQAHLSGSVNFPSGTTKGSVPLGAPAPSSKSVHSNIGGASLTNTGNTPQGKIAMNVVGSDRGGANAQLGVQHPGPLGTNQALGSGGNLQGLPSRQGGQTSVNPNASVFSVGPMQRPVGSSNPVVAGTTSNQTVSTEQKAQSLPP